MLLKLLLILPGKDVVAPTLSPVAVVAFEAVAVVALAVEEAVVTSMVISHNVKFVANTATLLGTATTASTLTFRDLNINIILKLHLMHILLLLCPKVLICPRH